MRICYLAPNDLHTKRWVTCQLQHGIEAHVISFIPGDIAGASVYHLDSGLIRREGGNWGYLRQLPRIIRLLRQLKPDILHAHYLTSYGLIAALTGFRPLVLTAWGTDVLVTPSRHFLYRLALRWTLSRADVITSDAETMTQKMLSYTRATKKFVMLPLGVDSDEFNLGTRTWPVRGLRVISTRQCVANSNLATLVTAIGELRAQVPDIEAHIFGDGPEQARLETLTASLSLQKNLFWHGNVSSETIASQLQQSDIYVSVTFSDSTSVSLLEAMASGVFPIVSDLPANREWVVPGHNGLLVSPMDPTSLARAIMSVVDNKSLRERAAFHNSKLISARADWKYNMQQMARVYERLLPSGGNHNRVHV